MIRKKPLNAQHKVSHLLKAFNHRLIRVLMLIGLFAILVILGFSKLSSAEVFPIQSVSVEGKYPHLDPVHLKAILTPLVNTGFFAVDVNLVQERLQTLPWVAFASIRRIWPDRLVIVINERQAIAVWNQQSLLDLEGIVFSPASETFSRDLPRLQGPVGSQNQVLLEEKSINQIFSKLGLSVKELSLSSAGSWTVRLNNGLFIMIGPTSNFKVLEQFVTVYAKLSQMNNKSAGYADLRYDNGFALRWQ